MSRGSGGPLERMRLLWSGGEGSSIGVEGAYPWVEVQPNRYRHPAAAAPTTVRIVIAEYLVAEIASLPVEKVLHARLD